MIEEHYAAHIKNRLDAAAINVQRPRAVRKAEKEKECQKIVLLSRNGFHLRHETIFLADPPSLAIDDTMRPWRNW